MLRTAIVLFSIFCVIKIFNLNGLQRIIILSLSGLKRPTDAFKGFRGNLRLVQIVAFGMRFIFVLSILLSAHYFSKDFYAKHAITLSLVIGTICFYYTTYKRANEATLKQPLYLTGEDHMLLSIPPTVYNSEHLGVVVATGLAIFYFWYCGV